MQRVLGVGRFAITYQAWDTRPPRQPVAIKTLNDEMRMGQDDLESRERAQIFLHEAIQLGKCNHPHVVKVYDLFEEDRFPHVVMEFVAGDDLKQCGFRFGLAESLEVIQQIGSALDHVHSKNIIHRDVRPGNIRLRAGEANAVLIDFGSVLSLQDEISRSQSASHAGGFAAPEAYARHGERGAWTDLYSLGAVLYWLVIREQPVTATDRKLATRNGYADPLVFPSSLDASVVSLIERAMRLKGHERPSSAALWLEQRRKRSFYDRWMRWSRLRRIGTVIGTVLVMLGTLLGTVIPLLGAVGGAMQGWESWFGSPVKEQPKEQPSTQPVEME